MKRFLLLLTLFVGACSSTRVQHSGALSPNVITFSLLDSILTMPPSIIPELINGISNDSITLVGFQDPTCSQFGEVFQLFFNRKGIINAFLVDFYLSKEIIEIPSDLIELLGKDYIEDNKDIYCWKYYAIYPNSVIAKMDSNEEIIWSPLSKRDMRIIQRQYKSFWEENKELPIEQIRMNYNDLGGILKAPYVWL